MAVQLTSLYKPKGSDLLSTFVDGMASNMAAIEKAYPVGSIWISVDQTSPQNIIGGRWKAIGSGRVLVTAGFKDFGWNGDAQQSFDGTKSGMTGGFSRHTHLNSMGFDGDKIYCKKGTGPSEVIAGNPCFGGAIQVDSIGFNVTKSWDIKNSWVRLAYTRENSSYPPYYTVYMWERTG